MCTQSANCLSYLGPALAYWVIQLIQKDFQQNRLGTHNPSPAVFTREESYTLTCEKRGAMLPRSLSISNLRAFQACVFVQADFIFRYRQGLTRKTSVFCIHARENSKSLLRRRFCTARQNWTKSSGAFLN